MHFIIFSLLLGASRALLVPPPPGPYSVAVKHIELIDQNRIDTFAPKANTKRRFMASAYLPIDAHHHCKTQVVPYMPALTAKVFTQFGKSLGLPQGMFATFRMDFCDISTVKSKTYVRRRKKKFPVAVLSPGRQGTRLIYGALARSLASFGYIIISVDHTYETAIVEFPDGSVAYAPELASVNVTVLLQELEVRTADVSFLISQLSNTSITTSLFASFPGIFDPHKIAVYGHSLGGATAVISAQRDPRVIGGADFDGTIYGAVDEQGFKGKPFVLAASAAQVNSNPSTLKWAEFYKKLDATKIWLAVKNTQHYAFTDIPLLLSVYQVPTASQPTIDKYFGKLRGKKFEKVVDDIMAGLLELLFHKRTASLKHVARNPDIDIVHSNLPKCK